MAGMKEVRLARLQARATVFAALHASPRRNGERTRESVVADAIAIVSDLEFGKTERQEVRRAFERVIRTLPAQVEDGREVKSAHERRATAKVIFDEAIARRDYPTARAVVRMIVEEQPKKDAAVEVGPTAPCES